MKKRWLIVAGSIVVIGLGAVALRPARPGTDVSCASCTIELTRVATIGEEAGPLSPRQEAKLSMNSRGEYAATRIYDLSKVVIYGRDGRVAASWGRKGSGPGEFKQISFVSWLTDDSLVVIDYPNHRLSVWLRDGTLIREAEFNYHGNLLFRSDGLAYMHRLNATRELVRPPFLILKSGEAVVEFGETGEQTDESGSRLNALKMALGRGDSLWVTDPGQYQFTLYAPDGHRAREIIPNSRWFRTKPSRLVPGFARGARDFTNDVTTDEQGRMWAGVTHVYVREQIQSEERRARERGRRERSLASPSQADSYMDYVLEVLDPATGEAIAARVFETGRFGGFIDGKHMWTVRELDDGQIVLDVWRFSLNGAAGPT